MTKLRFLGGRHVALGALGALALLVAVAPAHAHAPHDLARVVGISPDFANDGILFAALELSDRPLFARSFDGGRSWQEYGLPMMLSDVTAFAFSPGFAGDRTCFASTLRGGVWRTQNRGLTWQRLAAGLPESSILDVAVSPGFTRDRTVLLATRTGCYRSADGGDTWTLSDTGIVTPYLSSVAFAPGFAGVAFVGGTVLHRSEDGGQTWIPVSTFAHRVTTLALSANYALDNTLAVGFGRQGNGVFVSVDGGASMTPMAAGLTDLRVTGVAMADDGTLFAITPEDGVFRAPAVLDTWTLHFEGLMPKAAQSDDHYLSLAVSPVFSSDRLVFLGAWEGLFRSSDGGLRWDELDVYPLKVTRAIRIAPDFSGEGSFFIGSYGAGPSRFRLAPPAPLPGGIGAGATGGGHGPVATVGGRHDPLAAGPVDNVSLSPGMTWEALGDELTHLYSTTLTLAPDFLQSRTVFYSYQNLWRSDDAGHSWTLVITPENVPIIRAVSLTPDWPSDPTIFLGTNQGGQTYRSPDAGVTWTVIPGLPPGHSSRGIATSPAFSSDGTVFLATMSRSIFRSTDGGLTFLPADSGIRPGSGIRSFAMSPTFPTDGILLAGSRESGLYRTVDGGVSWQLVSAGLPPAADLSIEHIAFSPDFGQDQTVFLSTLAHGVYRTVDGGVSWSPVGGAGLPISTTRSVAVSPDFANDGVLLLSTNDWIWKSRDAGETWQQVPGGLRVDDMHHTVTYTGAWQAVAAQGAFGPSVTGGNTSGDSYQLQFQGRSVACYAALDSTSGMAQILLDGLPVATVDLYSPDPVSQVKIFETSFADVGWHTIAVQNTGSANPASSGTTIWGDGFDTSF